MVLEGVSPSKNMTPLTIPLALLASPLLTHVLAVRTTRAFLHNHKSKVKFVSSDYKFVCCNVASMLRIKLVSLKPISLSFMLNYFLIMILAFQSYRHLIC